jgi:hypothetical protein
MKEAKVLELLEGYLPLSMHVANRYCMKITCPDTIFPARRNTNVISEKHRAEALTLTYSPTFCVDLD